MKWWLLDGRSFLPKFSQDSPVHHRLWPHLLMTMTSLFTDMAGNSPSITAYFLLSHLPYPGSFKHSRGQMLWLPLTSLWHWPLHLPFTCHERCSYSTSHTQFGFPGGASGQEPAANPGDGRDGGLIPGWGRSPGVRNGNPLQYSCMGNSTDRGDWRAIVHGVAESDVVEVI